MKLGAADRKKVYALGGLVVVGGYLFYSNVLSNSSSSEPSRPATTTSVPAATRPGAPAAAAKPYEPPSANVSRRGSSGRGSEEFRPSLKPKRPEDRVDPMTIDPTLRLDLLAKVQAVSMEGGHRNLFQSGAAPPVALPQETLIKPKTQVSFGPQPPPPPPGPPAPPQAPPITLKYYGYTSARGDNKKHAFFLDGEDILVAAEGETVKKRYRVVRIGVSSVVMEDTQFKHEQTLPLLGEEAAAG